eukprot:1696906-Alexandrium_andersonii.AAC.1
MCIRDSFRNWAWSHLKVSPLASMISVSWSSIKPWLNWEMVVSKMRSNSLVPTSASQQPISQVTRLHCVTNSVTPSTFKRVLANKNVMITRWGNGRPDWALRELLVQTWFCKIQQLTSRAMPNDRGFQIGFPHTGVSNPTGLYMKA